MTVVICDVITENGLTLKSCTDKKKSPPIIEAGT